MKNGKDDRPRPDSHILIIRFSLMGDVAMSLHAIRALREKYPELRMTIATKPRFAQFYKTIPDAGIITLDNPGNLRCLMRLTGRLLHSDIDCVADIHNTIRGKIIRNVMRLFKGCRIAVLDKQRGLRRRLRKMKGNDIIPLRHNVLRFCDVFARLGFPIDEPVIKKTVLPVPEGFRDDYEKCGGNTGGWVGFAPFASKVMKIYPENLRTRLIEMMSEKFDRVFIFGGPGVEKEFAVSMEKRFPNVVSVFGKTDIQGEIALMSNLKALVSMDSSAMHMASLVGTHTVSVWGATHPAAGFYGYGENPQTDFVQVDLPCRPCSIYGEGKCVRGDYLCLNSITPEMIMKKLQ